METEDLEKKEIRIDGLEIFWTKGDEKKEKHDEENNDADANDKKKEKKKQEKDSYFDELERFMNS